MKESILFCLLLLFITSAWTFSNDTAPEYLKRLFEDGLIASGHKKFRSLNVTKINGIIPVQENVIQETLVMTFNLSSALLKRVCIYELVILNTHLCQSLSPDESFNINLKIGPTSSKKVRIYDVNASLTEKKCSKQNFITFKLNSKFWERHFQKSKKKQGKMWGALLQVFSVRLPANGMTLKTGIFLNTTAHIPTYQPLIIGYKLTKDSSDICLDYERQKVNVKLDMDISGCSLKHSSMAWKKKRDSESKTTLLPLEMPINYCSDECEYGGILSGEYLHKDIHTSLVGLEELQWRSEDKGLPKADAKPSVSCTPVNRIPQPVLTYDHGTKMYKLIKKPNITVTKCMCKA